MSKEAKVTFLKSVLESPYDQMRFQKFIKEFLNEPTMLQAIRQTDVGAEYEKHIEDYAVIAKHEDNNGDKMIVLSVTLHKNHSVERARTLQRNFISKILEQQNYDAAMVAFSSPHEVYWRLSFVRPDLTFTDKGLALDLPPAKRFSYLVGEGEPSHTAQEQLLPILENDKKNPTIEGIEKAFSVEKVTKEFFELYKNKYLQLKDYLEQDEAFRNETEKLGFEVPKFAEQFAKKLLGQLAFLYFIQKKGWLGVRILPENHTLSDSDYQAIYMQNDEPRKKVLEKVFVPLEDGRRKISSSSLVALTDYETELFSDCFINTSFNQPWGSGERKFISTIFKNCVKHNKNFFDKYLEPLFYEALNKKRKNHYFNQFNCKIPFLNGGLFEPLEGYHWRDVNFNIPNSLFSNEEEKGRKADGILDIFERFNFTMNEDEPLEKEVAVDPEMLGKIFENLLDVHDRKSKGAFYTPREIVHYMCQESLVNYLVNEVDVPYEDIREFILYGDLIRDMDSRSEADNRETFRIKPSVNSNIFNIDRALENIKVADPAVGSGAFPLGLLSEIVRARNNITDYFVRLAKEKGIDFNEQEFRKQRSPYQLKRDTIKNSIFAVDIEPSAVDIAKLRLWLSVVVDQEINEENPDPKPLPNLDMNILVGNSLIDEYEGVQLFDEKILKKIINNKNNRQTDIKNTKFLEQSHQIDWWFTDHSKRMLSEMNKLQSLYFDEENEQKKTEWKEIIEKLQDQLIEYKLGQDENKESIKKYEQLKKMKQKPYFLWHLEFSKVFQDEGGFDIVIGNPPYIGEKGNKELFHEVKKTDFGERFYQRRMDYFYFFIAKGIELLKPKGIISFITTNYWVTASGGKNKLRPFIRKNGNFIKYINFGEYKIFDSALGQHNSIFVISKNTHNKDLSCQVTEVEDIEEASKIPLDEILLTTKKLDGIKYFESQSQLELYESKTFNINFHDSIINNLVNKITRNSNGILNDKCIVSGGISSSADKVTKRNIQYYSDVEVQNYNISLGNGILVLEEEELDCLDLDESELIFIKPYFKSSDIKKYWTKKEAEKFLVYATHKNATELEKCSKIFNHLLRYKKVLENRSQDIELANAMEKGHWFVLTNGRPSLDLETDKIVCPYRAKENIFSFNDTSWYAGRDVYYLLEFKENPYYLLGILNSSLIKFWLKFKGKRKGDIFEIYPEPLKNIPLPFVDEKIKMQIIENVMKINDLSKNIHEKNDLLKLAELESTQKEINQLVFKLYKLNDEDTKSINDLI